MTGLRTTGSLFAVARDALGQERSRRLDLFYPEDGDPYPAFDLDAAIAALDRIEAALVECDKVFRGPMTHESAVKARDLLASILGPS